MGPFVHFRIQSKMRLLSSLLVCQTAAQGLRDVASTENDWDLLNVGVDCWGSDITSRIGYTFEMCQNACNWDINCNVIFFNPHDGNRCYLKTNCENPRDISASAPQAQSAIYRGVCGDGWTTYFVNGIPTCFQGLGDKDTQSAAKDACASVGGYLPTPKTSEE